MKLGAQLYTVRQFTKTPEDIEKTLRKIKAMGFDVIQISGFGPMDPHKLGDLIHELELDVCITHNSYERLTNDLDNLIEEHRLMGCDAIGIGSMPNQFRGSKEGAQAFIKEFNEIAKKIADAGMKFGYHNHDFEFERFDGRLVMDMLLEDTVPEFGFILDTYWLQAGGVSPEDYIRRASPRMKVCHFKDMKIVQNDTLPRKIGPTFTEVGTGNLNLAACMKACIESGVSHIVIEQDICEIDPFESLGISYVNLKKLAADAGALEA